MNTSTIEAQVIEINDGPYFNVKLGTLPHVGDLIDLYSLVDEAANYQPDKHYEVVQVLHKLYEVPANVVPNSRESLVAGTHLVTVFVKPSTSNFFALMGY
jgi:hypothetical protein